MAPAYPADFLAADKTVAWDEGGYQSAAQAAERGDPGGETKFGISKANFPNVDIANLTPEAAQQIRFENFWQPFHFDQLPDAIAAKVYNLSINVGPANAVICLQRAIRAITDRELAEDGVIGAETLDAVKLAVTDGPIELMVAMRSEAAGHYRFARALTRVQRQMNQSSSFSPVQKSAIESAFRNEDGDQLLGGLLNRAYE